MSSCPIITGPDNPILRTKSKEVKKIDPKVKKVIKNLKDTLKANPGIGLSAPQIGENIRVVLIKMNSGKNNEISVILVNPKITARSEEETVCEEGCLSLPNTFLNISRAKKITVHFLTEKDQAQILQLEDMNARVTQHELDHLDAVLIVDKAVPVQI